MSYKIGLDRIEVESAINELVKTGHLVLIANDTLIAVEDYVIWNYFKFHKANNKKSQFHKQILQAEQEGKLTQDWHKLPYVAVSKKKQYLNMDELVNKIYAMKKKVGIFKIHEDILDIGTFSAYVSESYCYDY